MDIKKIIILFCIFAGLNVVALYVFGVVYNSKQSEFLVKQQKLIDLQIKNIKADSLYRVKELKYREDLNSRINKLTSDIETIQYQNDYLVSKSKTRSENYKNQKYKPIKYW